MGQEIRAFLAHLRLHYQFLILSGAFLSGAVLAHAAFSPRLWLQFLSVHVLLFGGVTVYNSYWDKDTGPIGGLRAPPPLAEWARPAAWALQAVGLGLAFGVSWLFAAIYAVSMLSFWLYSSPRTRWKGRPWLSLIAIGVSTGVCGFLLGYLHDGQRNITWASLIGALGVAGLIVSLFPMSQAFQVAEDLQRRDMTFTARFGMAGMRRCYATLYPLGLGFLSAALASLDMRLGGVFLVMGGLSGLGVWRVIRALRPEPGEYGRIMNVKYATSALFGFFLITVLGMEWTGWPGH
jgi:1,4-dihydroxy-2-naphthoate octaprenyltransferase